MAVHRSVELVMRLVMRLMMRLGRGCGVLHPVSAAAHRRDGGRRETDAM